ncbi:MAG TPA: hypothetical protein VF163_02405 [Micromonosporaceae bacterium]
MYLCTGLGSREELLAAQRHRGREGGAQGHAGDLLMSDARSTDIVPGPGGVMTDEVGVVTGELTLRTEVDDQGGVVQRVQYKDADEWYVVTGSRGTLTDGRDIDTVHAQAVALLSRPEG